jgi:hypothetical protein
MAAVADEDAIPGEDGGGVLAAGADIGIDGPFAEAAPSGASRRARSFIVGA